MAQSVQVNQWWHRIKKGLAIVSNTKSSKQSICQLSPYLYFYRTWSVCFTQAKDIQIKGGQQIKDLKNGTAWKLICQQLI